MRFSASILLVLPVIVAAQEQKPLLETLQEQAEVWFEKAKSYIPPSLYSPTAAASAKIAAHNVTPLTQSNWESVLSPSTTAASQGPENWMVYVTGGNKTCFGMCDKVDAAWNQSAALFAVDPTAPHLATIDCEYEGVLCNMWAAGAPSIWYIELPVTKSDQSKPATTIHIVSLNHTATTSQDIVKIHTEKTYLAKPAYEGYFHPFDGVLAQYGLQLPLAYTLYVFGKVPSWLMMVGVSFLSRSFMSRRTAGATARPGQPLGGAPPARQ